MPTFGAFWEFKREFKKIMGLIGLVVFAMDFVKFVAYVKLQKGPFSLRAITVACLLVQVVSFLIGLWTSIISSLRMRWNTGSCHDNADVRCFLEVQKIVGFIALVVIAMNLVMIVVDLKLQKGPLILRAITAVFLFVVLEFIIYL